MTISDKLRAKVAQTFDNRCAYCQSSQKYVMGVLEIDHITPISVGGFDEENNLCLACRLCNGFKGAQTQAFDPETETMAPIYNPRIQTWSEHFKWDAQSTHIIDLTPIGRATVDALKINNDIAVTVRKHWVSAGWHPPKNS